VHCAAIYSKEDNTGVGTELKLIPNLIIFSSCIKCSSTYWLEL